MAQPSRRIASSSLLCPGSKATGEWNTAVGQLYDSLSRGYAIIKLTDAQSTALIGCQHAFERFFNLPEEQKRARTRSEDASVRGYFELPRKEVYETALSGDNNTNDAPVQPLLTAVRLYLEQ